MRRRAALLALGVGALLLTPGAAGVPDVPGDPTPPVVTPVVTGTLGDAGWYRSNVTVNWTVVDPESIILSTTGCDARTLTSDTASTRLTCTAESDGGETTVAKTFKLDKTAPAASATPSRPADANGWYNHDLSVAFAGSDATSGLQSCSPPQVYEGPDTPSTSVGGTCRDQAGNTAPTAFPLKYDETSPLASPAARAPDANGWYNHALTVTFQGADGTSGIAACTQLTYAGPDDPSVALTGTCVDQAGNESTSAVYTLAYDETDPVATATAARTPDVNGWYNHPLTVSFGASDATSGLEACEAPKTYAGPDALSASVTGVCRDRAGNAASPSVVLKYDSSAPQVATTPARAGNALGWYNAPLAVTFTGSDSFSGVASCDAVKTYSGPDSAAAVVAGSCGDHAGNSGSGSFTLRYDTTAPQASATPSRQPNANGWFNAPLSVSFTATDATSTVDSCDAAKSYSGPDSASASLSGVCRDKAGNTGSASLPVKYDATPPQTTATSSRQPNTNGWFNAPLNVSFAATDATSTVDSCDPAKTYAGPDAAATAVSGACRDKAGNAGTASLSLKYDATAPQASATPSRQPNVNGWYNAPLTISFAAVDTLSGLDSCPAPQSYGGPDSAAALVSGTCLDKAGNGGLASFAVKYDQTAPVTTAAASRQADHAGWYNAPLSVGFAATDAGSGVDSCDGSRLYERPDTAVASIAGACRDRAGNSSTGSLVFKYDATPPEVTSAVPVRLPDRAGWYNHPVVVDAEGTDATSSLASCPSVTYAGPDGDDARVAGSCVDVAGNLGFKWFSIDYDGTGPQATAIPSRAPDADGWYNRPLTVSFAGSDSISGLASCTGAESYGGPDSLLAIVAGFCLDRAGNAGVASLPVRFDATAPQVTGATPERTPDANGWYNHPLAVGFQGSDATSGIDACAQARYAGPDTGAASLTGSCRDRAGNGSAEAAFTLRYDATAPSLTDVRGRAANRAAMLSWVASADTVLVEILRAGRTVYRGTGQKFTDRGLRNGVRYRYTVKAYDEAHNAAADAVIVRPNAPLLSPTDGATVTPPVRLAWTPVDKATHYNVQVFRRGKIFSAWPKRTSIRLPGSWTYRGRRHRLAPGRYRWLVWPGYGRARKTYGPLLGSSTFVVRAPS